jgi:hypothetical protein
VTHLRRHRHTGQIAQYMPTALQRPGQTAMPEQHWVCAYYEPNTGFAVRIVDDEIDGHDPDGAWEPVELVSAPADQGPGTV